jgi:integrase
MELQWSYLHDDRIEMPPSQSKSNRLYITPMTPQIRAELDLLREIKVHDEWVFPSDSESGRMTTRNWASEKVRAVCGLKFTNHSLRYTFATIGEELEIKQQVVSLLMDHSSEGNITDRYQLGAFLAQTGPAIEKIDARLAKLLGAN